MTRGRKSVHALAIISRLKLKKQSAILVSFTTCASITRLVTNPELASLWNLFEGLQSRSNDKYGLDKDVFFRFLGISVSMTHLILSHHCVMSLGFVGVTHVPLVLRRESGAARGQVHHLIRKVHHVHT